MPEPKVTETEIIEFMHNKVQRLTRTIQGLLSGKPVANFLESLVVEEGVLTPEQAKEIGETFNRQDYQVLQVLTPVPTALMKEVIAGEFDLLDELWPMVKEALALQIASHVLRHNKPTYDFDTKMLMKQMLYPEERD